MGNVARLGDSISCGDHIAAGSSDVLADGMPITTSDTPSTTGHGCFPPTTLVGPWSTSVFVNGARVALLGTNIAGHKCGKKAHAGSVSSSAGTVWIEA